MTDSPVSGDTWAVRVGQALEALTQQVHNAARVQSTPVARYMAYRAAANTASALAAGANLAAADAALAGGEDLIDEWLTAHHAYAIALAAAESGRVEDAERHAEHMENLKTKLALLEVLRDLRG